MLKWSVELKEFDNQYLPRTAIKPQALDDFISELPPIKEADGQGHTNERWTFYVNGSAIIEKGAGLVL